MDKKRKAALFEGWGIPPHAAILNSVVPDSYEPVQVPYAKLAEKPKNLADAVERLGRVFESSQPELVIGWSQGAQISSALIAAGKLRPKFYVSIGQTTRLIDPSIKAGWKQDGYERFRDSIPEDPIAQLAMVRSQFLPRVSGSNVGAIAAEEVARTLAEKMAKVPAGGGLPNWKGWIEIVRDNDFVDLNLGGFKGIPVLLVQARDDLLVPYQHGQEMERLLKAAGVSVELEMYEAGGHAPFAVKDAEKLYVRRKTEPALNVKQRIAAFVNARGIESGELGEREIIR